MVGGLDRMKVRVGQIDQRGIDLGLLLQWLPFVPLSWMLLCPSLRAFDHRGILLTPWRLDRSMASSARGSLGFHLVDNTKERQSVALRGKVGKQE